MIGESLLGLLAVLACTAGFKTVEAWNSHYQNWENIYQIDTVCYFESISNMIYIQQEE